MSLRTLLVIAVLCGIGWWFSPLSLHVPAPPAHAVGTTLGCPMPPRVSAGDAPRQTDVPSSLAPFRLEDATLRPLAGFSVEARVLSREEYSIGREADVSPTDLALGWASMRDDAVLSRLDIRQSSRWYSYRWQGDPPLPPAEISRSSANMHMIPSNASVARALSRVRRGDQVRIDGWLVQADAADGWRWRSSTSRDDTGSSACELVYVCAITPLAQ